MKKILFTATAIFTLSCIKSNGQQTITRKDLLNAVTDQKVSMIEIKEVTLAAGQPVPKHVHPCPVAGYISSGTVLFQIEGEESKLLKQGDAFYEPKNKIILHFDNASKTDSLTFIAFYLKEGNEEIIKLIQ